MKSDFLIAVTQLAAERNLPREVVISAIEAALISVYKKDSLVAGQNLLVKILPNTGEVKVSTLKTIVEEVEDPEVEISLAEAGKYKQETALGEVIEIETTPQFAGRIAAQTAKQVVMQRLKEAERELVYEEFADREGEIVGAIVQRIEPRQIALDVDKTEAVMPMSETVPTERYRVGQRLKVLIVEVNRSPKGPQVIVSRSHRNLASRLFELEVPEVYNGTVEIREIAREPGYRTKVAVSARQEGVDPVGSCVGLRGIRIQNIVNELHGERIDVVKWDRDPALFIANALSPAQVSKVEINEEENSATVVVPDRHLSLSIGKEGQNARLAAKVTGWRIDIKGTTEVEEERLKIATLAAEALPQPEILMPEPASVEQTPVEAPAGEVTAPAQEEQVPVAEIAPAETASAEEVPPEKLVSVETELPQEEMPVVVKSSIAKTATEAPTPKPIEEIWPIDEKVVKPAKELRFAEDINVSLPGRSESKTRKGKAKTRGEVAPKGRTAKAKRTRTTVPSYDDDQDD